MTEARSKSEGSCNPREVPEDNNNPFRRLAGEFNRVSLPPAAPQDDSCYVYHGNIVIGDPFRPLEYPDNQPTQEWVAAENMRFETFVAEAPHRQATKDFLTRIWDYPKKSLPGRYGDKYFSSSQDGLVAQPVYEVRNSLDGPARTLIDPNTLSADGTVALGGVQPSDDGKLVAYTTSEAGSDAQTLRIRDVETGQDLPDVITGLRFTDADWDEDSSQGFQYMAPAADSKRRFVAMHHNVGDPPAVEKMIFEFDAEDAFVRGFRLKNSSLDWMSVSIGTLPQNGLWGRKAGTEEPFRKIFDTGIASFSPFAEVNGKIYMVTDHQAPRGKLVALDPAHPEPENWETILPESSTDPLNGAFVHQGRLYGMYSHDAADQLRDFDLQGIHHFDVPIPVQSTYGFGHANPEDKELLISISNFKQPGAAYKYDVDNNTLTLWRPSAAVETLDDCIVERIEATSKDGAKVPMTVIRDPNTKLDGTAAVKLYGYGGFNVPLGPGYSKDVVSWVRSGGIYVQANLRGGGEFGSEWYDQGRLHNKQNVFDDFAACGRELSNRDYTSPERLVIEGGSNGGLLTLETRLQYPELFGAVISKVPVADLYRFHKYTYGAAWKSDYGNPETDKGDFYYASTISPLHTIKEGGHYPPLLVLTGDHDDRVAPGPHAEKYVATEQAKAADDTLCLLRVETRAGHGAGKPTAKVIQELVDIHAFIEQAIGPINQDEYKAALAAFYQRKPEPQAGLAL
jgi:prolyl oligopeptidase